MRHSFILIAVSVVAALYGCNPAAADDNSASDGSHLHLGGYGSVGAMIHPGGKADAAIDNLSLLLNWDNGGRLRFFTEVEVEDPLSWRSGEAVTASRSDLDVERIYFDYSLSGAVNARVGRFLTPIGRWNTIHAAPLVWTTTRPGATVSLFPTATNGAMLYGSVPWEDATIDYAVFGEMLRDDSSDFTESSYGDTRGLRLAYSGGLDLGVTLSSFEERKEDDRYTLLGLDFAKNVNGWEWSGEYYRRFAPDGNDHSGGGYLQSVAPVGNDWYLVGRIEHLRLNDQGNDGRWLIGAAWRLQPKQVFKVEYAGGRGDNAYLPRGLAISFAILF